MGANDWKDGNSHAFAIICRAINILVSGYGTAFALANCFHWKMGMSTSGGACALIFVLSISAFIINERELRYGVEPHGFMQRIQASGKAARTEAYRERENLQQRKAVIGSQASQAATKE